MSPARPGGCQCHCDRPGKRFAEQHKRFIARQPLADKMHKVGILERKVGWICDHDWTQRWRQRRREIGEQGAGSIHSGQEYESRHRQHPTFMDRQTSLPA